MSIKGPLFEMLNGRNPDILECPPHRFLCEDKAAGRLAGHQHSRCSPLLMGWSSRVTFAAPARGPQTWPTLRRTFVNRANRRWGGTMRGFHNSSFDPPTLVVLEAAFDEAWWTLKSIGNTTVKPDELARSVLRLAMEGERDPVRLHDEALEGLIPATAWREAS
jgi:hypothetical protein